MAKTDIIEEQEEALAPEITPEPTFTAADLKAAGIENITEITTRVQDATKALKDKSDVVKLTEKLAELTEVYQKNLTGITESQRKQIEEEAYENLTKEKAVEMFKGLPADDPQRIEIKEA